MREEMVIFTRTFDFVSWLMPRTAGFPREQRFVVTKRLQDAVLDFYECLVEANRSRGRGRLKHLHRADVALDKIRHYLRLCAGWNWLSLGQHRHAAQMVAELGDLLGGWQRATLSP